MKLRLMTFNTEHCKNFLTEEINYKEVINLIKKHNPDIIGLNEIYGKGFDKNIKKDQAEYIANQLGYYYYFGKASRLSFKPYGNAILSKYPIMDAKTIKIPYPFIKKGNKYYERRSIIKCTIQINNQKLAVYVTHLGLNPDEQLNGINTIIKSLTKEKFIIMGDFNMNYDNKTLLPLENLTINADTKLKAKKYTWPSDNPKYKFDYIFTSKNIKVLSADIPSDIVSDHLPYIAEISN